MNAIQTDRQDSTYSDKPPVLIGASSDAALARAVRGVEAAGCRIGDTMPLVSARERIERQVAASAVWIELDCDCGATMDDVLDCIVRDVAGGRYAAVVSSTAALIDPVSARVGEGAVQLIVDADEGERAAALAIAAASAAMPHRLSDVASDQNAARLRQLSDEVSRASPPLWRDSPLVPQRRHRRPSRSTKARRPRYPSRRSAP